MQKLAITLTTVIAAAAAAAVAVPAKLVSGNSLKTRDPLVSFNTYTSRDCNGDNSLDAHSPLTADICHPFGGNERSLDVYFESGTRLRKYLPSESRWT